MTDPSKSKVDSIRARLLNITRQRATTFAQVFTQFLLERALVRLLADPTLSRHLIFKGDYVGVRVYQSPRHTTDLDALLHKLPQDDAADHIKFAMAVALPDHCWFEFEESLDLKTQGEYGGTRFSFRAGLGERPKNLKIAQIVNIGVQAFRSVAAGLDCVRHQFGGSETAGGRRRFEPTAECTGK